MRRHGGRSLRNAPVQTREKSAGRIVSGGSPFRLADLRQAKPNLATHEKSGEVEPKSALRSDGYRPFWIIG